MACSGNMLAILGGDKCFVQKLVTDSGKISLEDKEVLSFDSQVRKMVVKCDRITFMFNNSLESYRLDGDTLFSTELMFSCELQDLTCYDDSGNIWILLDVEGFIHVANMEIGNLSSSKCVTVNGSDNFFDKSIISIFHSRAEECLFLGHNNKTCSKVSIQYCQSEGEMKILGDNQIVQVYFCL